ncbi:MAG: ATP-dependent DNA helicase RecG [Epulopiscium sp.]|jgi:ATP-dependent DNA helicase RecG|nr:ATP-dependent DNA helicase RecG [Candidatus Epulonipiscium sp.]
MNLSDPVDILKGVGEQTRKKLNKLDIYSIEDLLYHFPREYEDRSKIIKINEIAFNESNTIIAKIASIPQNEKKGRLVITKVKIKDETGTIFAVWYGQAYLKKQFNINESYIFTGKVLYKYGKIQMESPEFERYDGKEVLSSGRIIPIYPATYKLSQKIIRQLIYQAIKETKNQLLEFLPKWIRKKYQIADYNYSILNIHFPESLEDFFVSRERLVFEELFILQTGLLRIKNKIKDNKRAIKFNDIEEVKDLIDNLPFKLTKAQIKVFDEIKKDMLSDKSMNRLIQGDVGSGKTVIAALALYIAVKNNYQGVMMAPTEVLASQHYQGLISLFEKENIKIGLLTGSLTKKNKELLLKEIEEGTINIVIGTHALIQEKVVFKSLGLVITDEQHRFGVAQRRLLFEKGSNPDVLVMTATPIPRTLALILYGDLDISIIDELPPGRQKIDTYCVDSSYRERIYKFIKKELDTGRQAYIICPAVEESEIEGLQSVINYTEQIKNEFKEYRVSFLYGKMKAKEKQKIMEDFLSGEIQILVSTTVVEVGVNVPNASIMLIENAERFGLSQLHQLRGRVGRSIHKSYCILITDSKSKIAKERMKVMEKTNDGFKISETDLHLRGPGEFFGTRQHGIPDLKIANLYKDIDILKKVQDASKELLKADPNLEADDHLLLKEKIDKFFEEKTKNISL